MLVSARVRGAGAGGACVRGGWVGGARRQAHPSARLNGRTATHTHRFCSRTAAAWRAPLPPCLVSRPTPPRPAALPAGPLFDGPQADFYNLELSDTNVTDHNTHDFLAAEGLAYEVVD